MKDWLTQNADQGKGTLGVSPLDTIVWLDKVDYARENFRQIESA